MNPKRCVRFLLLLPPRAAVSPLVVFRATLCGGCVGASHGRRSSKCLLGCGVPLLVLGIVLIIVAGVVPDALHKALNGK
jgi:hypothetical protein